MFVRLTLATVRDPVHVPNVPSPTARSHTHTPTILVPSIPSIHLVFGLRLPLVPATIAFTHSSPIPTLPRVYYSFLIRPNYSERPSKRYFVLQIRVFNNVC